MCARFSPTLRFSPMTTKRTRFDRRKKPLVAPGRVPDEIDEMLATMRRNDTFSPPTINCRRCGRDKPAADFKPGERSRAEPTCLSCCAAWLPRASEDVRAIVSAEKPKPPLAPLVAYRRGIVIAEESAAEDAYFTELDRLAAGWAEQEAEWEKWRAANDNTLDPDDF